jgi:CRP/FNR family transcriptional regulator, cyclic AMP receptor protein
MDSFRYAWESYLSYGKKKSYTKDTVVCRQGEEGNGFYYVSQGYVKTTLLSDRGDERILNFIPSGMIFGEVGINKDPYLGNSTTATPCVLYHFSYATFNDLRLIDPQAGILLTRSLLHTFRKLSETIKLLDCPIEQQMAHYLTTMIVETDAIPIDQTSMAKDLGTSRVTINKVIQKWKNKGVIQFSNRIIHIIDREWFHLAAQ